MTTGERIRELRITQKISQAKLASYLDVSTSTIGMYEQNRRRPSFEKLEAIADFFNVSLDYIMCKDKSSTPVRIPVLGFVRAGLPMNAVENIIDYEEISAETARSGEFFALQIKGDSMEPKISEGDVVIVKKQSVVNNGEVAVVLVNGDEATVKKFYKSKTGIKLISTNPSYDPLYFSPQEVDSLPVEVIGKVVELRAKF